MHLFHCIPSAKSKSWKMQDFMRVRAAHNKSYGEAASAIANHCSQSNSLRARLRFLVSCTMLLEPLCVQPDEVIDITSLPRSLTH